MNFGFGFLGNGLGCLRKETKKEESWRRRRRREELSGEEDGEMGFVLWYLRLGRGEWDGRWRKKKNE